RAFRVAPAHAVEIAEPDAGHAAHDNERTEAAAVRLPIPHTASGDPDVAVHARARALLDRFEVGIFEIDGESVVGVWSDCDSAAMRGAIGVAGGGVFPITYRDSSEIPDRRKGSGLPDEPIPLEILHAMEKAIDHEPWRVRDQMLLEWNRRRARPNVTFEPSAPGPEPEPQIDWRPVQVGFAVYEHWKRWDPRSADAHRHLHRHDEMGWLVKLAVDGRPLKLTLDRLEHELQTVRAIIAAQPDPDAVNRKFIGDFQFELAGMRERSANGRDPLGYSHHELQRFVPM